MILSCTECGACCATPDDSLCCGVTAEDRARLGRLFTWRHMETPPAGYPELVGVLRRRWRGYAAGPLAGRRMSQCVALDGDVMQSVRCKVYGRRPEACRGVEPGDAFCESARKRAGA